jgi:hypothetical protein
LILACGFRALVCGWWALLLIGLWQSRNILIEGCDGKKLFISWQPGNKREIVEEARGKVYFS